MLAQQWVDLVDLVDLEDQDHLPQCMILMHMIYQVKQHLSLMQVVLKEQVMNLECKKYIEIQQQVKLLDSNQ